MTPDSYEIVVVKNFRDDYIDNMGVRNLKVVESTERSMGKFILAAYEACESDIIAFLEDDDMWDTDKLQRVLDHFSNEHGLIYYHNAVEPVSPTGEPINSRKNFENAAWRGSENGMLLLDKTKAHESLSIGKYLPDFNLSSMAVHRRVIDWCGDCISRIDTAIDTFLFLSSLTIEGAIELDSAPLTQYRRHELNQSGSDTEDWKGYLERLSAFTSRAITAYGEIQGIIAGYAGSDVLRIAKRRVIFTRILNGIQSPRVNRYDVFRHMLSLLPLIGVFNRDLNAKAVFLALAYVAWPSYARKKLAESM